MSYKAKNNLVINIVSQGQEYSNVRYESLRNSSISLITSTITTVIKQYRLKKNWSFYGIAKTYPTLSDNNPQRPKLTTNYDY